MGRPLVVTSHTSRTRDSSTSSTWIGQSNSAGEHQHCGQLRRHQVPRRWRCAAGRGRGGRRRCPRCRPLHRPENSLEPTCWKLPNRIRSNMAFITWPETSRDGPKHTSANSSLLAAATNYTSVTIRRTATVCWLGSGKKPANCWYITPNQGCCCSPTCVGCTAPRPEYPWTGSCSVKVHRQLRTPNYCLSPNAATRDPSPDAVGQRDAQRNLPASVGELIDGRQQLQEPWTGPVTQLRQPIGIYRVNDGQLRAFRLTRYFTDPSRLATDSSSISVACHSLEQPVSVIGQRFALALGSRYRQRFISPQVGRIRRRFSQPSL